MHNFYCPDLHPDVDKVTLPPDESRHALQVLRLTIGDSLRLFNGAGMQAEATIQALDTRRHQNTCCRVQRLWQCPPPSPAINLYLAPPKSKVIDQILRAATELGVAQIIPLHCQFGVSKPDQKTVANWQKQLLPAAKQSGNPWLPKINTPVSFDQAVTKASEKIGFFGDVPDDPDDIASPSTKQQQLPSTSCQSDAVSLWIGPEGGFAPPELQKLRQKQLQPLTIGKWIMRVETAVPALLAVIWHLQQQTHAQKPS